VGVNVAVSVTEEVGVRDGLKVGVVDVDRVSESVTVILGVGIAAKTME